MEIIQEIGSYAGFAAVLGLAVLSALYFSQARDVKRLREWAGRAPERTVAPAQPQRVVAEPIARPAQQSTGVRKLPPVPRPPGAQPGVATPAAAAAAGAAPAMVRGPAPATPAAAGANATEAGEQDAPADVTAMDTVIHPPPDADRDDVADGEADEAPIVGPPAEDAALANGDEPADADGDDLDAEQAAGEEADLEDEDVVGDDDLDGQADEEHEDLGPETGEWSPEDEHSDFDYTDEHDVLPATPAATRPPQPPRPLPRRTPPPRYARGESTTILPSYDEIRSSEEDEAGSSHGNRRPALIVAGAVLAAAVLAFGVLQLTGGDDDSGSSSDTVGLSARQTDEGADGGPDAKATPIDPSSVTVAVLNGTQVPGLAAQIGDQIAGEGFQLGTVTNNFDQERAESVVLFAPGAEREAADVGRRLGISQREEIDPDSQSLAGDASVVVVAGADQTQ